MDHDYEEPTGALAALLASVEDVLAWSHEARHDKILAALLAAVERRLTRPRPLGTRRWKPRVLPRTRRAISGTPRSHEYSTLSERTDCGRRAVPFFLDAPPDEHDYSGGSYSLRRYWKAPW